MTVENAWFELMNMISALKGEGIDKENDEIAVLISCIEHLQSEMKIPEEIINSNERGVIILDVCS